MNKNSQGSDKKPTKSGGGWSKWLLWLVLIVGVAALLWQIGRAVMKYRGVLGA